MSEYWKSTVSCSFRLPRPQFLTSIDLQPKYWCKFCKTYVRDTTFERKQHEATGKHQGNIQRSLRDLHRGQEREAKDKQRAKDEVARLNAAVGSSTTGNDVPWKRKAAIAHPVAAPQATPEERKRQLAQLAEMGIAIPREFRGQLAMAGDWQTVSETPVGVGVKKEEDEFKPDLRSMGVRKRRAEDGENDEDGQTTARRGWGSTYKAQPTANDSEDLEALFGGNGLTAAPASVTEPIRDDELVVIKKEESQDDTAALADGSKKNSLAKAPVDAEASPIQPVKTKNEEPTAGIVFKKRKTKGMPKT